MAAGGFCPLPSKDETQVAPVAPISRFWGLWETGRVLGLPETVKLSISERVTVSQKQHGHRGPVIMYPAVLVGGEGTEP